MVTLGSLCSGAGGLDMAVEDVFGARTVWHAETDPAASRVLAARWPGVPNHGDLTQVDWSTVEPVDIMCAGWPCQPFSLAGKRKGADDDRAIWPHVADAVRLVRPRIVCLENVSAVLAWEFGRVANSLASLGYDLRWTCLRASDIGAPHRRERLFAVAVASGAAIWQPTRSASAEETRPTASDRLGDHRGERATRNGWALAPDSPRDGRHERRPEPTRLIGGSDAPLSGDGPDGIGLLPTPSTRDHVEARTVHVGGNLTLQGALCGLSASDAKRLGRSGDGPVELLPTPAARDFKGHGPAGMDRNSPNMSAIADLLPTPNASDGNGGKSGRQCGGVRDSGAKRCIPLTDIPHLIPNSQWGKYAPAIRRWETLTRPAPAPTEPNRNGNPRLNPAFSEWMMGWPAGWVTDVDISRNDKLRIVGNGVVPQCAAAALRWLLSLSEVAA